MEETGIGGDMVWCLTEASRNRILLGWDGRWLMVGM